MKINKKLCTILGSKQGDTIIEVVAAFVIMVLLIGLFTASLRIAGRFTRQAEASRTEIEQATAALRGQTAAQTSVETYQFTNRDGGGTAFSLPIGLGKQTVSAEDGQTFIFYQFLPKT